LGAFAFGVWRWKERIWPRPPKPHYESGIVLDAWHHWGDLKEFTNSVVAAFGAHKMEFFQPDSIALRNWEESIRPPMVKMEWTVKGKVFVGLDQVEIKGHWPNNSKFQNTVKTNDWRIALQEAKLYIEAEMKRLQ